MVGPVPACRHEPVRLSLEPLEHALCPPRLGIRDLFDGLHGVIIRRQDNDRGLKARGNLLFLAKVGGVGVGCKSAPHTGL